ISKGCLLFFFQAEDGIRDRNVTGVQTCALPIFQKRLEYEKDKQTERINGDFSNNFKTKLFNFDFANEKIDKQDYKERLLELQERMREIQFQLYQEKVPLILVYEGMDAAGKGGNIK